MATKPLPAPSKAAKGEKMIELRIRFWTNNFTDDPEDIIPKHGWDSGVVAMDRNDSHGIHPKPPTPFRSIVQLPAIIESVLIQHGIVLHPNRRLAKYIEPAPNT